MAIWRVRTYYRKSCQTIEYFSHKSCSDQLEVTIGFRSLTYEVITKDNNPPEFEFARVPHGDGKKDSIDFNNCAINNIESSELIEMFDGGHWLEIKYPSELSQKEKRHLRKVVQENGSYALEEDGNGWTLTDTEAWAWGPLEISNEKGEVIRIIAADENGNVIDHTED